MFSQDFKEFVALLIKNNAGYLIVGGYAVGIHGHHPYTGDIDHLQKYLGKNSSGSLIGSRCC